MESLKVVRASFTRLNPYRSISSANNYESLDNSTTYLNKSISYNKQLSPTKSYAIVFK